MGGGVAMRAAAKITSFGGGLRAPSVPLTEQSRATALGKALRPANSVISSGATEEGRSAVLLSSQNGKIDASIQRPLWDVDDWEFTSDEEDLSMPRVVFGGVPTLEEAKEATCELKDALEQMYLSSNPSDGSETKVCVTKETAVAVPSVPKHALQAFVLLKESSAAQSVVSSLASDKNIWDAMMKNEKVMEFLQSQPTTEIHHSDMNFSDKESCADNGFNMNFSDKESCADNGFNENIDDGKSSGSSESGFMGFIQKVKLKVTEKAQIFKLKATEEAQNVKLKVTEMVRNMSGLIQDLFGGSVVGNTSLDEKDSASGKSMDKTIAGSFLALAMLVIMLVLLKRR